MKAKAQPSLLDTTLRLLKADKRPLMEIATSSGLGHNAYFWLRNLKQGAIKNPGVRQIEILHNFLTK